MKASLLALAALGAVMAYAVPTEPDASSVMDATALDGGITLDLHVHNVEEREVLASGVNLKRSSSLEKRQSVAVTNIKNLNYYVRMSFGTPAQSFLIDIDTGSNDLWVIGKECGRDCPGSEKFDPLASSTSLTNGAIYSVRYGAGQVSGRYSLDTVGIAGYQLQNQSFAIIEKKDAAVLGAEGSGLIGLGFGEASEFSEASLTGRPVWQALAHSRKIAAPLFTLRLGRPTSSKGGKGLSVGGALTLGVVDPKQYSGPLIYTNLATAKDWTIQLDSIKVNGRSIAISKDRKQNLAAIDSGTAFTVGPDVIINAIHAQIPGAERYTGEDNDGPHTAWTVPCDVTCKVSLGFGGKDWQMDARDLKDQEFGKGKDGKQHCLSTFLGFGAQDVYGQWIIGANFLKNVFTVFDGSNAGRIGFAQLN